MIIIDVPVYTTKYFGILLVGRETVKRTGIITIFLLGKV